MRWPSEWDSPRYEELLGWTQMGALIGAIFHP